MISMSNRGIEFRGVTGQLDQEVDTQRHVAGSKQRDLRAAVSINAM
jgi:hypothetical protein